MKDLLLLNSKWKICCCCSKKIKPSQIKDSALAALEIDDLLLLLSK
jgi:hypothetical protein